MKSGNIEWLNSMIQLILALFFYIKITNVNLKIFKSHSECLNCVIMHETHQIAL